MDKTISIMLVTRGRLQGMIETIDSLIDNCKDKSKVELLIKLDPDDTESVNHCTTKLRDDVDSEVVIEPRGRGYYDMNVHYNHLWPRTKGQLLSFMSDDMMCETYGWDELIEPYAKQRLVGLWPQHKDIGGNLSPILHRSLLELAGTCGHVPVDIFWEFINRHVPFFVPLDGHNGPEVVFRHVRGRHGYDYSFKVDGTGQQQGPNWDVLSEKAWEDVFRVVKLIQDERAQ